MKKLTSLLIVLVLVVGAVFALTACDQTDKDAPTTVMNVSLNPEVEFVLDGHGKVVTVNALNEDGSVNTAHSLNPVPFVYVTENKDAKVEDGVLADVAPSILHILGMAQPAEMDGKDLIK